jgi:hypothetical protein
VFAGVEAASISTEGASRIAGGKRSCRLRIDEPGAALVRRMLFQKKAALATPGEFA